MGVNESLAIDLPLASQWHPTKNGIVTPGDVTLRSNVTVWWLCPEGHEWQATVSSRAQNACPVCAGGLADGNDLATTHPDLAAQWSLIWNWPLTPRQVTAESTANVGWSCPEGHEWQATVRARLGLNLHEARGTTCPVCEGRTLVVGVNDLATVHPDLAAAWQSTTVTPRDVTVRYNKPVWWKCDQGHEWRAKIQDEVVLAPGQRCPQCSGQALWTGHNDLATTHAAVAALWDTERNGGPPSSVMAKDTFMACWQCPRGHKWQKRIDEQVQSPFDCYGWDALHCRRPLGSRYRWSDAELIALLESLKLRRDGWYEYPPLTVVLTVFEGARMSRSAQRRALGMLAGQLGVGSTERNLLELVGNDPNLTAADDTADDVVDRQPVNGEAGEGPELLDLATDDPDTDGNDDANADDPRTLEQKLADLFTEHGNALSAILRNPALTSDHELAEAIIAQAVAEAWDHIYTADDPAQRVAILPAATSAAETEIRTRFLEELTAALQFDPHWQFRPTASSPVTPPSLMQRHFATLIAARPYVGNWSGTGAGKTAAAIAGAHAARRRHVVVICPNSVLDHWIGTIHNCYPQDVIEARTTTPAWPPLAAEQTAWLIINYETLSDGGKAAAIEHLAGSGLIDMAIFDEAQSVKIRSATRPVRAGRPVKDSARSRTARRLRARLTEANPDARIVAMTATPVVNDLDEPKSLIELLRGEEMPDLKTTTTLVNANAIHRHLVTSGIRYRPDYSDIGRTDRHVNIDGTHLLDALRDAEKLTPPEAERILFATKIEFIVEACIAARKAAVERGQHTRGRTLVYTELVEGVIDPLSTALKAAGLTCAEMSGRCKELDDFLVADSTVDVLIGSPTLKVGVDGLQHAVDQIIFAILPWTAADYEQVQGRVIRQGRVDDAPDVTVLVPQVNVTVDRDGEPVTGSIDLRRWSFITSKARLVSFAVDGRLDGDDAALLVQRYEGWLQEWLRTLRASGATPLPARSRLRG